MGRIILKLKLNGMGGRVDWINLGHDKDKWQAVVKTVMKFELYKMQNFCLPGCFPKI